jgi:hypothetical protein
MPRQTHDERERLILTDLQGHFPNFAGASLSWNKVPDGQDPPDFIYTAPSGPIGLELVEWLDGDQMAAAKGRESQRDQLHRILTTDWEAEYQPQNYSAAFVTPGLERVSRADEAAVRKEFFALAAKIDQTWMSNPDRTSPTFAFLNE